MNHEPIHQAPANDEAPTTRLRAISDHDDDDGADRQDETLDAPSPFPIEARLVVSVDADSSYTVVEGT